MTAGGGGSKAMRADHPAATLVDYDQLKLLENPFARGYHFRFAALGLCCALYWHIYDRPALFIWFPVFLAGLGLHCLALRRLPDGFAPSVSLRSIIATQILNGLLLAFPGLYLWVIWDGSGPDRILSLLLFAAAGFQSLSMRAAQPSLLRVDLGVACVTIAGRVGWLWWQAPATPDTLLMSIALLAALACLLRAGTGVRRGVARVHRHAGQHHADERERAILQFTGGVAHDFNNMLTAVLGNMELARLSPAPDDRSALMDEAERAALRGAELTSRLLALARRDHLAPRAEAPEALLGPVPEMAEMVLGAGQSLRVTVEPDLPEVHVDAAKLRTALLELISNARDALPDSGGEIVLAAQRSAADPEKAIRFSVTDRGKGIAKTIQGSIFEPYFTTKPRGQGSGLGLPMVRGFVEQSSGRMGVSSRPGELTVVWLDLPVVTENAAQRSPKAGRIAGL